MEENHLEPKAPRSAITLNVGVCHPPLVDIHPLPSILFNVQHTHTSRLTTLESV